MSFWKKLGVSLMLIMIIGLGFQDVSKDPDRTSIVWQHFILDKEKERAKCKHCGKEFKFLKGSSTKGLLKHLKETKVHSDLKLNNDTQVGESESTKESNETENSKVSVKKYFPSNKKTVQQIVTDLAISGASFNFIAKCETLKKSFRDNGYEMPDSPTTVQKYVLAVAKERTAKLIEDVKQDKSNGTRLALSLDEYTAKKTLDVTSQRSVRTDNPKLSRNFSTNDRTLRYKHLKEHFFMDTFFATIKAGKSSRKKHVLNYL